MKQNLEGSVRRVADFLGFGGDEERIAIAAKQASFEFMRAHESQFDDHLATLALCALHGSPPAHTTKVRAGRMGDGRSVLSARVLEALSDYWRREIELPLGIRSYSELCELLR